MTQQVIHAPDLRKYRTELPNLVDDMQLDPYSFRLLVHYYRVGNCWESVRTTAKRCCMSVGKVSQVRRELARRGLIEVKELAGGNLSIRVRDIWPENFAHFAKSRTSSKVKTKAKRKPISEQDGKQRQNLQQAAADFERISQLSPPGLPSEKRNSWLLPLQEICELAEWDEVQAERLIGSAYQRLRGDGLTISSPRSILKTARAIAAEAKAGQARGNRENSRDWERRVFGRKAEGKE